MTYPQWRTSLRIFHAMIRLAEGATVTETAHRCGWATTSAFIVVFSQAMGQTPGAYRDMRHGPGHAPASCRDQDVLHWSLTRPDP